MKGISDREMKNVVKLADDTENQSDRDTYK